MMDATEVERPANAARGATPRGARVWRDPLAAAIAYGSWGFVSNVAHGTATALRVAVGQGVLTAVVTLALGAALTRLTRALQPRWWLAVVCGVAGLHGTALAAHLAIGTPEILRTMGPNLVVGTSYVALFVIRQRRSARSRAFRLRLAHSRLASPGRIPGQRAVGCAPPRRKLR